MRPLLSAALPLCLAAALPAPAAAGTANCTVITTLPTTITTQGVYCLKQDLATAIASGTAITVATNNVTVDCNGFRLVNAAGAANTATGVATDGERLNTTLRGCAVRAFRVGLNLQGDGHLVEDSRIDASTLIGMFVTGDASMIRRNRVFTTGGAAVGIAPVGIFALGSLDVSDNIVTGVTAVPASGTGAAGIFTSGSLEGVVARNDVSGIQGDAVGSTYAIRNDAVGRLSLRDNTVSDDGTGIAAGIYCSANTAVADGNHVLGFDFNISGCQQGSGNTLL
jgi:hypothetical protein